MTAATAGPALPGRIRAFDLARGLAVGFMILIHVLGHFGDETTWATPAGVVVTFLGGPLAAPVFMFLMGASLSLSRRSGAASIARRAIPGSLCIVKTITAAVLSCTRSHCRKLSPLKVSD